MDLYSARIHQLSGAQGALSTNSALTGTHLTPGWREAIMIKCLAQGHKCHGRDSNPHSAANTRT